MNDNSLSITFADGIHDPRRLLVMEMVKGIAACRGPTEQKQGIGQAGANVSGKGKKVRH